jgi:signal transduction histidine kinase
MIAVDTVGHRLGSVTNCNSHTKVMLGFEKDSIIGKNITKIMPKIYTDLHDDFLLNFLRNKSEKLTIEDDDQN